MKKRLRNDLILILFVLILGFGLFIGWYLNTRNKGKTAIVYHKDEVVAELDLYKNQTITVEGDISSVVIVVNYGKIWVKESGCPNHICIEMGKKSHENETITCLPNQIYIVIVGGDSNA
jgi:hypothetical protein